ncbi:unnamed protein product [Malassezia sympodialis ATCC 42132]|nr:uncharacterized protein MSY001_2106 [Malassezia sympodialis ATCC 42132]CCU99400.1 unnamed protein product [Malassezia sympodialis ATCC 42132]|eukprot:XP_018740651.1 uncharacterized protein MSY001_2106 [Malassezia sympodialis ATCC 42132]
METVSHTWHVLDVVEGSPADSAGLVPFGDYIIGWTGGPLQSEGDFFQLVEQCANTNLSLYVYNSDYDHTREIVIVPNRDWGGEGLLGCGIGYGLLHRIPKPNKQWEDSVIETTEAEPVNDYRLAPPAAMQPTNTYETGYDEFEPQDSYNYGVTVSVHQDEEE